MFKSYVRLFLADCEVIKFSSSLNIYPIYKNGRSSLTQYAKKNNLPIIKNKEISQLDNITLYIRDPIDRFVSGVHTFFYLNNLKITNDILKKINNFEIVDQHFMPQCFWLMHLFKYFKNNINLKNINEVYNLVPIRSGPWQDNPLPWKPLMDKDKKTILTMDYKKFTDIDYKILLPYMNKVVKLDKIVKEIKNVLS
jgi:hypothetical protein